MFFGHPDTVLCQLPLQSVQQSPHVFNSSSAIMGRDQRTQTSSILSSQHKRPSISNVMVRTKLSNMTVGGRWQPVSCPQGHMTHVLLACDTSAACWAGGDVTFSRHSDSWATPTSQSCPMPLVGPPLPPSFACRSQDQHVVYSLVCDHRRDCLDGSDETFCHFPPCSHLSQFQCHNKQVCHVDLVSLFLSWLLKDPATPKCISSEPVTPGILQPVLYR